MALRSPSSSYSMSNSRLSSFSYDVFLSFRGDNTRKAFTDHLYTALKQAGIRTFRDDDAMERGRLLKAELEKAIHQSQISLIVFSKSYATSKWCLDEVLMIMEEYDKSSSTNKREVVPVFYNIEPTDVRNQTGCFQEAFKGYIDELTREKDVEKKMKLLGKVKAWRSCLRKAGSLTGMVLSTDGYEAKFISSVVKVIRKKLKYNALYIDEKLVGIAENIAEIESWLQDPSPNAMIYVIDGMGGVGKTTIAKCVFNSNCREYDCSCFLADINDVSSQPKGMLRLQSQLLSTILNSGKKEKVWNEYEGTTKITDAVCNKKILLVLDDVTTLQQLNALLGPQRFYPGSKVIITTRHTWLSTDFKVHPKGQTIRELSSDKSIELFSLHAFDQNQPTEAYVVQSKLVDRYCKGLPLALKVLGSYLRGKSIDEWEDAMFKLESNPLPGIQNVLHSSYESLEDDNDKDLFLDIACFLVGEDKDYIVKLLAECNLYPISGSNPLPGIQNVLHLSYESLEDDNDKDLFLHIACFLVGEDKDYIVKLLAECNLYPIIGIKNLTDRCLLYIEDGKVGMHQLIREMGLEVVRLESPKDPGKRSRLWQREDCINTLQENVGTKNVEGFRLDMQHEDFINMLQENVGTKNVEGFRTLSSNEVLGSNLRGKSMGPSQGKRNPRFTLSGFSYDVFLGFQGEYTRKTFTDNLYKALKQNGICTFRYDDAMQRGRLLKPLLKKAIQQSQVSLIVFSKEYATSKWCLDEVLMIMEEYDQRSPCKREVVPVFYNIEPTDVRNQTGCFEEAFKGYDDEVTRETGVEKKMELLEKVEAWRVCLRKAGSLTGMVLAEDGYETEFISSIVNVIRKKVNYNALYIKDKLVGMKEDVAWIESWLQDPSPNSTILFIDGMGGIGKTTVAKCVYNMNFSEYDGGCFLANINETSNQSDGMLRLQRQLLSTILKSEKKETISNEYEGTTKVANAICNKKVLIVLDDVATFKQLEILLGPQRFYPGSKVIITTRHTWLSNWSCFKVPPMVQTIRTLSNDDSVELFSLFAFPQNQPIEPYYDQSELVNQAIHHCAGLPLALEVLGSNLRGKSIAQWKDAMSKLEKYPLDGIQTVLQLSYDSLEDHHDKELFLHIACFFVGEDEDFIVKVLGECKLYLIIGIKNLIDRSLLYIEYDGKVGMHQLIREMGKEVVRQESPKDPGKRSRLWDHEDCINVLQENMGTKNVEGFRLDMQNIRDAKLLSAMKMKNSRKCSFEEDLSKTMSGNETNFKIRSLQKMKNLMLLQLRYVTFSGKYKKLPKRLRLLRWHGFPLKSIPGDIPLEKLVVLDMSYSKLERVWDDFKFIGSLKILNLSYSVELIKTPFFGGLPCLEWLILKGCTSLITIDESFAYLRELVLLDVTDCRSLRNVPCLPRSLVSLQKSGCTSLGAVEGFQCLYSISLSSLLVKLNISNCNLFDNSFPNDWSNLVSLVDLNIDGNNVTYLPKCIQSLPRIQRLEARGCPHIKSVLGPPKTLTRLHIEYNMSLVKVQVPHEEYVCVFSEGCQNLSCIEGRFKWQTIEKVERKIIQNLGLGSSNAYGGIDLKQKVVFEYGIFSTCVTEEQIPSCCFMYKERGPQISFIVPSHHHRHRIISGFTLCVVFSPIPDKLLIELHNKTKDLEWGYMTGTLSNNVKGEKGGWLSVWRCDNLLHAGDEIFVRILHSYANGVCWEVEECCMNLIYDDEDVGERKEGNENVVISEYNDDDEIIRWSDKVDEDISDYVHSGMDYRFGHLIRRNYDKGFLEIYKPQKLYDVSVQSMKSPTWSPVSLPKYYVCM